MKVNTKTLCFVLLDLICCAVSFFAATLIYYDFSFSGAARFMMLFGGGSYYALYLPVLCSSSLLFGLIFRTYKIIYINVNRYDVFRQLGIAVCSAATVVVAHFIMRAAGFAFPIAKSICVMFVFAFFLLTLLVRSIESLKNKLSGRTRGKKSVKRVLIVGAGDAGNMLIHTITTHHNMKLQPVGIVDDNPLKRDMVLSGVKVLGTVAEVPKIAKERRADEIIVAIPSGKASDLKTVFEKCKDAALPIKTFGSLVDFNEFIVGNSGKLRDVAIEDLLFRNAVETDMSEVSSCIKGKTVLVTGGAGSIGSEICRQLLEYGCRYLVVMDINENGLFYLRNSLLQKYGESRFCVRVGSVRDKERMGYLFRRHKFDIVFHAAAHKHVPLMEDNMFEAVKNNIFGTKKTIECCIENNVERFVLISTDKAVNPTNIMGATKRVAELLCQHYNGRGTELSAVRFGNVLGSNGSVIPVFKRQIEEGGPVTVTHPDIQRYFMTIPEAVSLVLNAGVTANGGEVFVLDMGEPVKIYDLAKNMIELSGLKLGEDIQIEITGLRPGEKMFEELKLDSESVTRTSHDKIFIMHTKLPTEKLEDNIETLSRLLKTDSGEAALRAAVFETISMDFEENNERSEFFAEEAKKL